MSVDKALHVVEIVHWIALGVMAVVYTARLFWIFSFNGAKDRSKPSDTGNTTMGPAVYSMFNVAMPWAMESTRTNMTFYFSFVIFHLGVVAGISLAFVSSLYRPILEVQLVSYAMMAIIGAAFLVGMIRILRRLTSPVMKLISTPDDIFAVVLITGWFASGLTAQAHIAGLLPNKWFMVVFLAMTSFFLVYVPFSKISHYLYYPFTRYWIGKALGRRGSLRPTFRS